MKAMFPQSGGGDLMQQLRAHGREVALIAGAAVLLVALVVFRGAVRSEYRSLTGQPEAANDPAAVALAKARARREAMAKGATTGAAPAAVAGKAGAKGAVVATTSKAAPAQAGAPSKANGAPTAAATKPAAAPASKAAAPNAAMPNATAPNATAPNATAPNATAPNATVANGKAAGAGTAVAGAPATPAAQTKAAAAAQKRPATARDSASGGVMREVYGYVPDSRRDPFNSLLKTGDLRPTLAELRLLGILYDETGRHPVAILRDAANTQYRVTTGQQLGRMRVARIKRKAVVFTIEEFGMNRMDSLVLGDSTKARAK